MRAGGGLLGVVDLRRWYIMAAQGESLHRRLTCAFMSKAETHHFLTAPPEVGESARAFWYGVARAPLDGWSEDRLAWGRRPLAEGGL